MVAVPRGHGFNVHEAFRRRPWHLLNVSCTTNLTFVFAKMIEDVKRYRITKSCHKIFFSVLLFSPLLMLVFLDRFSDLCTLEHSRRFLLLVLSTRNHCWVVVHCLVDIYFRWWNYFVWDREFIKCKLFNCWNHLLWQYCWTTLCFSLFWWKRCWN